MEEAPHILCLQETKWDTANAQFVKQTIGRKLDSYLVINAEGTAGGVLLAWDSGIFTKLAQKIDHYCLSVDLAFNMDDTIFRITGAYGPSTITEKQAFYRELQGAQPQNLLPWIVCGDLNVTLLPQDRTDNSNHRTQTNRFRTIVEGLQLQDLRLQGRAYTWSNEQENPIFARLDRFLISTTWSQTFPNSVQTAIPNTASDHCPLICQVQTKFPTSNIFRLENSWLKREEFKELVNQQWGSIQTAATTRDLSVKIMALRKAIIHWKKMHAEEQKFQSDLCKNCLHWLAQQSERRRLTNVEKLLKNILLQRYTTICHTEEEKWFQRAKRAWVSKGDKNSKYFHLLASKRKRANLIDVVQEEGVQHLLHKDKAGAIHRYFAKLMGARHISGTQFDMSVLFTNQ
ncbi:uncharacterized protein LOC144548131 [Carex rostrata]